MNIIGCDFHARSQQIALVDAETGEMVEKELDHENGEARKFYAGLKEPAWVGIESTSYTRWFAEMLAELGHELVGGTRRRSGPWRRASRNTIGGMPGTC
jgi:transposase